MKYFTKYFFIIIFFTGTIYSQKFDDITGFFSGKIGKNLSVTLSLYQMGDEVDGYYHYDKNNVDIKIHGTIHGFGEVELEEYGYFEITGYWKGKLEGDKFNGKWINSDKSKSIPFNCNRIKIDGSPGDPIGSKVSFGEAIIELKTDTVTVPAKLAATLLNDIIEDGSLDPENEYDQEVIKKGKANPSVLFIGESVDLNDDNIPELVVYPSDNEGACTSHNCYFWIYSKTGGEYKRILSGFTGIAGYRILNGISNYYHNIVCISHASAAESEFEVYKFNGIKYQLSNCITQTANYTDQGNVSFSFKEHPCSGDENDPAGDSTYIGYFKDFEIGDYVHAVFYDQNTIERSFWLPADDSIQEMLEKNKGRLIKVIYEIKSEFLEEANGVVVMEMIKSLEILN